MTTTYMFAHLKVADFGSYIERYAMPFAELLPQYEGEVVSATTEGKPLEGETGGNWTVLIKFPSREKAEAFYNSDEYAPLLALRKNELTTGGSVVMFPEERPEED